MKRLGPDLKMPNFKKGEVKVPPVFGDLFYDLRERRLLAPLALLLVAILAVPFVLGGGSGEPAPAPGAGAVVPAELETTGAKLTVVEAKPGLRDYRKRLKGRQPTNPFKQRFSSPQVDGAELDEDSSTQTTTVTTGGSIDTTISGGSTTAGAIPSSPSTSPPSSSVPTPSSPPSSTAPGKGSGTERLTFFTWSVDVWVKKVPSDPEGDAETTTNPKVLAQTPLPGPKTPVVTFMGLSREAAEKNKTQKALFLVSDEVSKISDGAKCISRGQGICQLLEVKPGDAITFVYGPGETRYRVKVLKIELVVTGHS